MNCIVKDCINPVELRKSRGLCEWHYRRTLKGIPLDLPFYSQDYYLRGKFDFIHKDIRSWSRSIRKYFSDTCMVCGWQETTNDCHHIIPRREGGLNTLFNAAILCPNHHKLADQGKIERSLLQSFNKKLFEAKQ